MTGATIVVPPPSFANGRRGAAVSNLFLHARMFLSVSVLIVGSLPCRWSGISNSFLAPLLSSMKSAGRSLDLERSTTDPRTLMSSFLFLVDYSLWEYVERSGRPCDRFWNTISWKSPSVLNRQRPTGIFSATLNGSSRSAWSVKRRITA